MFFARYYIISLYFKLKSPFLVILIFVLFKTSNLKAIYPQTLKTVE